MQRQRLGLRIRQRCDELPHELGARSPFGFGLRAWVRVHERFELDPVARRAAFHRRLSPPHLHRGLHGDAPPIPPAHGWRRAAGPLVCAVALVRLLVAVSPFPILVLPFLLIFWALYSVAPRFDVLQPIAFAAPGPTTGDAGW